MNVCAFNEDKRTDMFNEIEAVYPNLEPAEAFRVLMGGHIEGCDPRKNGTGVENCLQAHSAHVLWSVKL